MCLPTGDTPGPVYRRLVRMAGSGATSLGRATVILLDEYVGLPPADPARCDTRLDRELISGLHRSPSVHRIRVDDLDPVAAAAAHDLVAAAGIDLAVVGLGMNGHVGFNEPGSGVEAPTRVVTLTPGSRQVATARYGASAEPLSGITLGMDRLLASREIWLLVRGATKAAILKRALEGPQSAECPASWLRRHPRLTVLADEPAAAGLG